MRQFLTIDTGGTKTRLVQFDNVSSPREAFSAAVVNEIEIPTPHGEREYIAKIVATIQQDFPDFIKFPEENVVILATRGDVDNDRVTTRRLGWQAFPVAKLLQQHLPGSRVLIGNDTKIGALAAFGAGFSGRGMYVALGSGIGVGLVIDGRLSPDLLSMEAGHMWLKQADGSLVEWESLASGVAFATRYGLHADEIPSDSPIWREYADNLSTGLYILLPTLRPERVSFGGAIAQYFDKFGGIIADNLRAVARDSRYFDVTIAAAPDPRYTVNRGALIFGLDQIGKANAN